MNFISVNEEGKLKISDEAVAFLQSLDDDTEVSIVSVVGPFRSGKSHLLNQLQGNQIFTTSHRVDAATKGIWIGNSLVGPDKNILLMDTEGLGSLVASQNHDQKIFSISIMLASCLIFNTQQNIDSNSVSLLEVGVQIADMFGKQTAFGNSMPSLTWLLRDFSLTLENPDGKPLTPSEYVESSLEKCSPAVSEAIRRLLPDRRGFVLPNPHIGGAREKFSDDFNNKMDSLIQEILTTTKPKMLGTKTKITGPMFLTAARAFIEVFENQDVFTVTSVWENIVNQTASENKKRIIVDFDRTVSILDGSPDEVALALGAATKMAMSDFVSRSVEVKATDFDELFSVLSERVFDTVKSSRNAWVEQQKKMIMKQQYSSLDPLLQNCVSDMSASVSSLTQDKKKLMQDAEIMAMENGILKTKISEVDASHGEIVGELMTLREQQEHENLATSELKRDLEEAHSLNQTVTHELAKSSKKRKLESTLQAGNNSTVAAENTWLKNRYNTMQDDLRRLKSELAQSERAYRTLEVTQLTRSLVQ